MESSYSQCARSLAASLHLRQAPIAISFTDSIPAGISVHSGSVPAGCRFWQDASEAAFATSAVDHQMCAVGVYTHNLEPSPQQTLDLADALKIFSDLGYVRPEDLPAIPVLRSRPRYVIYAPLAEAPLPPDVVLLFVDAAQTLILSEAAQQLESQNAPAMGRPACAVVPEVMNSGRPALSLGCCGARAYLDVLTDGMALFAIPGGRLEAYAERVELLGNANAVLSGFHRLRRSDVEAGATPTMKDSIARLRS